MVKPKKHLGQHFLKDENVCDQIAQAITFHGDYKTLLEIGPGTGALTKYLIPLDKHLEVVEIDSESVLYLKEMYPNLVIREADILKSNLTEWFDESIAIVGNFPYNISSQILFKVLEYKELVPEVVGMFQKEVAVRICEGPGTKKYGILSVLIQAYYKAEYLFTVEPDVFVPPPKVQSGVLRLTRYRTELPCSDRMLKIIVKAAFHHRRKTLKNSLKVLGRPELDLGDLSQRRPEQISVEEFIGLAVLHDDH